jgi:hypothetical protein
MNDYLLQVHYAPGELAVGWDRAHHLRIVAEYDIELSERTGDDWADDIQAKRSCPDEPALLWLYGATGKWEYQVTIEGDPAGLRRCTRHAH